LLDAGGGCGAVRHKPRTAKKKVSKTIPKGTSVLSRKIVMLGTSFDSAGGVASVVTVYRDAGLFKDCSIEYIPTHVDGSKCDKLRVLVNALRRFTILLLSDSVAAVHAHTASRLSFWRKYCFFLLASAFGRPYLIHLHGGEFRTFFWKESGPMLRKLIRYLLDNSFAVIVLSERWKTELAKISSNNRIFVVKNPVMLPEVSNYISYENSILFLGSLAKHKGFYDLLMAVKRLISEYPDVKLYAGGTGEVKKVKSLIYKLGLNDAVHLLGWVRGDAKQEYLRKARVFFLVSYDEGLPMSLLEAMSYGRPVITSPVGGIPELVNDGIEGFLVKPGDVEAITEKLRKLFSDSELCQKMGAAGRKRIESGFSQRTIFQILKSFYMEIDPELVEL
jgi:glycosyltransferase involved in cell wall biosynthesis